MLKMISVGLSKEENTFTGLPMALLKNDVTITNATAESIKVSRGLLGSYLALRR